MAASLRELAGNLQGFSLITSPLGRARQTAERVAEIVAYDPDAIREEPRLKEHGFGCWEGELQADLPLKFPDLWWAREADKWNYRVPGGESYAAVAARVGSWLIEHVETARLIVVSHGLAGRILRGLYGRATTAEVFAMTEPQDAVFRLSQGTIARFDTATAEESSFGTGPSGA